MSPEAVACRFDLVDELRELAEELANAKRLGPVICAPAKQKVIIAKPDQLGV